MSAGDDRLYNVSRDVAHCFDAVCLETAERLEGADWPFLRRYIRDAGITESDLGEACRAYLEFVATATDVREERRPAMGLSRVGWFAIPEEAQFAFMAVLGTVMTGYFHSGVREATMDGVGPCQVYGDLRGAASRVAAALTLPPWRRRLAAVGRGVRSRLIRLLGGDPVVVSLAARLDQARQAEFLRQSALRRREAAAGSPPRTSSHEEPQAR